MARILAIDTSTQACSCALNLDGVIVEHFEILPRQHADRLLFMIDSLMNEQALTYSDLNAVAFGQGPGSFTGLRIAAGVTQGIAFGADIPVIPVSTLASMALQVRKKENDVVFSSLDARINEVYWGVYTVKGNSVSSISNEGLCKPEDLPLSVPGNPTSMIGVGSGLEFLDRMPEYYREMLSDNMPSIHPRAGSIAELAAEYFLQGMTQKPENISPIYLRDNVAKVSKK
jgi:tRNA threonylcarbamoyladenosine biosynthesis protein TsaB